MSEHKSLIILTGGQMGLGYETTRHIAKEKPDALVIIASRSSGAGEEAAQTINRETGLSNVEFQRLDLASLVDVRRFASQIISHHLEISALVLNAGLQVLNLTYTPEGLENTFGINHVGHALLFHLLLPRFTKNARVVVTASGVHDPAQKTGLPDAEYVSAELLAHPDDASLKKNNGQQRYATSKLCNVLWTYAVERHRKERGLSFTVNAMDPGLMPGTGLARDSPALLRWIWKNVLPRIMPLLRLVLSSNIHSTVQSGHALARLAVSPELEGVSGQYYEGLRRIDSSQASHDAAKQEDLWAWTCNFLGGKDATEEEVEMFKTLASQGTA